MGLKKYRADQPGTRDKNGALPYYSNWLGGPSLSLIRHCPCILTGIDATGKKSERNIGPRTVYIQGEADTMFSIPAAISYRHKGKNLNLYGYISYEDDCVSFRANEKELSRPRIRFPAIRRIAEILFSLNKESIDEEEVDPDDCGMDVCLQVFENGKWAIRFGSSDLDHSGYWGAASIPGSRKRFNSMEVAKDLIEQAKEAASQ